MENKKTIYEFECGPLDYWEGWHDLLSFSEVICEYIKKNPKESISYNACLSEMNELYTRVLCDPEKYHTWVSLMRGYGFHFCFKEQTVGCDYCPEDGKTELIFILGYKEDNNGTCKAFSFHHFCDAGDFDSKYKTIEDFFNSNPNSLSFGLGEGVIPSDFGDEWSIIPFDHVKRFERLNEEWERCKGDFKNKGTK